MAKHRSVETHRPIEDSAVPPELAAGPCLELWDDGGLFDPLRGKRPTVRPETREPWIAAAGNYGQAVARWAAEQGLSREEVRQLVPSRFSAWSADFFAKTGREAEARRRLGVLAGPVLGSP